MGMQCSLPGLGVPPGRPGRDPPIAGQEESLALPPHMAPPPPARAGDVAGDAVPASGTAPAAGNAGAAASSAKPGPAPLPGQVSEGLGRLPGAEAGYGISNGSSCRCPRGQRLLSVRGDCRSDTRGWDARSRPALPPMPVHPVALCPCPAPHLSRTVSADAPAQGAALCHPLCPKLPAPEPPASQPLLLGAAGPAPSPVARCQRAPEPGARSPLSEEASWGAVALAALGQAERVGCAQLVTCPACATAPAGCTAASQDPVLLPAGESLLQCREQRPGAPLSLSATEPGLVPEPAICLACPHLPSPPVPLATGDNVTGTQSSITGFWGRCRSRQVQAARPLPAPGLGCSFIFPSRWE